MNREQEPVENPRDERPYESQDAGPLPGLSSLSMLRTPERDLWAGIDARLESRTAPRRWWRPSYAAAAGVVLTMSGLLALGMHREQQRSSAGPAATPREQVAFAELVAEPAQADGVRAENRALVKANLKMIKDAETQLRQALAREPGADYLRRLLSGAEQQRKELNKLLSSAT